VNQSHFPSGCTVRLHLRTSLSFPGNPRGMARKLQSLLTPLITQQPPTPKIPIYLMAIGKLKTYSWPPSFQQYRNIHRYGDFIHGPIYGRVTNGTHICFLIGLNSTNHLTKIN